MNIPEYQFSNYIDKKLFKLGLKKSKFVKAQINNDNNIIIQQNTYIQNISNKTITIKKGYSLITQDLNNVSIIGELDTTLYVLGKLKGNIYSKGIVELALKSIVTGDIDCMKFKIYNNKKDQSINPSVYGKLSMGKSS
jgi:cytoskeletal protein CcmA (bactofilin family)